MADENIPLVFRRTFEDGPVDPTDQGHVCSWCGSRISDDREVFGFGAKARPGAGLKSHAGDMIELLLVTVSKTVQMIVVKPGSPAARAGFDFYFMTCGAPCATALKGALAKDIEVGKRLLLS